MAAGTIIDLSFINQSADGMTRPFTPFQSEMTRIFHIVILILVAVSGAAVSYAADKKTPAVRFEETVHDFGNNRLME